MPSRLFTIAQMITPTGCSLPAWLRVEGSRIKGLGPGQPPRLCLATPDDRLPGLFFDAGVHRPARPRRAGT